MNSIVMKKIIFFVIISIIAFWACTKDEPDIYKKQLAGSWHLDSTRSLQVVQPTDSIVLKFEVPGKYTTTVNATETESGLYNVTTEKNNSGADQTIINFYPYTGDKYAAYMNLENDALVLSYMIVTTDGNLSFFSRRK